MLKALSGKLKESLFSVFPVVVIVILQTHVPIIRTISEKIRDLLCLHWRVFHRTTH